MASKSSAWLFENSVWLVFPQAFLLYLPCCASIPTMQCILILNTLSFVFALQDPKTQKVLAATKGSSLKKLFNKFNPMTNGGGQSDATASGTATMPTLGQNSMRRAAITELPVSKSSRIDPTSVTFGEVRNRAGCQWQESGQQ